MWYRHPCGHQVVAQSPQEEEQALAEACDDGAQALDRRRTVSREGFQWRSDQPPQQERAVSRRDQLHHAEVAPVIEQHRRDLIGRRWRVGREAGDDLLRPCLRRHTEAIGVEHEARMRRPEDVATEPEEAATHAPVFIEATSSRRGHGWRQRPNSSSYVFPHDVDEPWHR